MSIIEIATQYLCLVIIANLCKPYNCYPFHVAGSLLNPLHAVLVSNAALSSKLKG